MNLHTTNLTIIVCHTLDHVIGHNGKMPWHLSADLKRFKQITLNHPIIMGRKTFESLPKQQPLPERENIILSRSQFSVPNCTTVCDLAELQNIIGERECFVIGGCEIYRLLLPYAKRICRTVLETISIKGDTYFPEIDISEWTIEQQGAIEPNTDYPYRVRFEQLDRIQS